MRSPNWTWLLIAGAITVNLGALVFAIVYEVAR